MSASTNLPWPDDAPLRIVTLPDATLRLWPAFLARDEADAAFDTLLEETDWRAERIRIAGREVEVPRRVAWQGDADAVYTYSGVRHVPGPWTSTSSDLRRRVVETVGRTFNSVLLNLYRDGTDGMGWHSDDEPELGARPCIASLSLGAERPFQLAHRTTDERLELPLSHGSLLVMDGDCQRCWKHRLPKRTGRNDPRRPRINLTFRHVTPRAETC